MQLARRRRLLVESLPTDSGPSRRAEAPRSLRVGARSMVPNLLPPCLVVALLADILLVPAPVRLGPMRL